MTVLLDVQALRRESLDTFKAGAKRYFAAHPECGSMVLGVSQYWADEAGDAVHEAVFAFPAKEPWWPHRCTYEGPAADGSRCSSCDYEGMPATALDSNSTSVYAWAAFCAEYGGGEGHPSLADPVAIARRGEGGEVELELVHQVVRPWMDDNTVAERRGEDDEPEEQTPRARPEPVRPPWTAEERPLIDAILANPGDDAPRRVIVDYWLEKGDVRGELGATSFDGPPRYVEEHGRTWLGPLQPFITLGAARFGRGPFVRSALVSMPVKRARVDVEDWAFLEEIRFAGGDGEHEAEHPVSRHMRGLRRVYGVEEQTIEKMTKARLVAPIDTVGLAGTVSPQVWSACPAFAAVKHLVCEGTPADAATLPRLPVWSRLESVEVWLPDLGSEADAAPEAWADGRGVEVIRALRPQLAPGARLVVGYQLANGAHAGVVAVAKAGSATLEDRLFAGPEARANASQVLKRLEADPEPLPVAAPGVTAAPPPTGGFIEGLLKRFGR